MQYIRHIHGIDTYEERQTFIDALTNITEWEGLVSADIRNAYKDTSTNRTKIQVYGALPKVDNDGNATAGTMDYIKTKLHSSKYPLPSDVRKDITYWLASPNLNYTYLVWYVKYNEDAVANKGYYETDSGVCPVVILPSNIQGKSTTVGTKVIWNVVID